MRHHCVEVEYATLSGPLGVANMLVVATDSTAEGRLWQLYCQGSASLIHILYVSLHYDMLLFCVTVEGCPILNIH